MSSIKICPTCKGEGNLTILNNNDYEIIVCERCKGSGKIYKKTYVIEMPFKDKNDARFHLLDKTIIESIQYLNKNLT